jgi:rRNA maturation protein Nop10
MQEVTGAATTCHRPKARYTAKDRMPKAGGMPTWWAGKRPTNSRYPAKDRMPKAGGGTAMALPVVEFSRQGYKIRQVFA